MTKAKTTPVKGRLVLKFNEAGDIYHISAMGKRAMMLADGIMDLGEPCPVCGNKKRRKPGPKPKATARHEAKRAGFKKIYGKEKT